MLYGQTRRTSCISAVVLVGRKRIVHSWKYFYKVYEIEVKFLVSTLSFGSIFLYTGLIPLIAIVLLAISALIMYGILVDYRRKMRCCHTQMEFNLPFLVEDRHGDLRNSTVPKADNYIKIFQMIDQHEPSNQTEKELRSECLRSPLWLWDNGVVWKVLDMLPDEAERIHSEFIADMKDVSAMDRPYACKMISVLVYFD